MICTALCNVMKLTIIITFHLMQHFPYYRDKLNQLGFSWELPTHTRRRKKGEGEVLEGDEAVADSDVSVAKSKEEKKTDLEVLAEILPAATSGGGSSKWPHEVLITDPSSSYSTSYTRSEYYL